MNDRYLEGQADTELAAAIGISLEELEQLDYEIIEDASDDGLTYSFIVEFGEGNPPVIMSKIRGLENDRYVYVSSSIFDRPDSPDE